MRLFVSINLPEEIEKCLRTAQAEVRGIGGGGRSVELSLAGWKSGFHLTLVFLGEVGMDVVMKLSAELKRIEFAPFELELASELGVFKDRRGFVKVVFAEIDKRSSGYKALGDLQKKVSEVVGRFGLGGGVAGSGRVAEPVQAAGPGSEGVALRRLPFAAHITLARVKFCPRESVADFERAVRSLKLEKKKFVADAFYLMESELGSEGAKYSEILRVGRTR